MRILIQRVSQAEVRVDEESVGRIGPGYLLLVGITHGDTESEVARLAKKVVGLRLFPEPSNPEAGGEQQRQSEFDRSLLDVGGQALVVSQFTLYGSAKKGRRPSFTAAAPPDVAEPLCHALAEQLRKLGVDRVETGRFGSPMHVSLINDGPVTLWLDSQSI